MNKKIDQILKELYALEPTLKKNETLVRKTIELLLENQPPNEIDSDFYKKLKKIIISKTKEMEKQNKKSLPSWQLVFGTAASVIAMILIALTIVPKSANIPGLAINQNDSGKVLALEKNAFGKLSSSQSASSAQAPQEMSFSSRATGRGGGGGGFVDEKIQSQTLPTEPYFPGYYEIDYQYKGEPIDLKKELPVYKRIKKLSNHDNISSILTELSDDLLSLNSFEKLGVSNFTISQDKPYGLEINVNLTEGFISGYQNWQTWNDPRQNCTTPECYQKYELKPGDMPDSKKIIELADQFIADHRINLSDYEPGKIENSPESLLSSSYITEVISVVYPLKIENRLIYNMAGQTEGLQIQVNIREMKVSGFNNLRNNQYQSSDYEMITDEKKITELAEKGGWNGNYFPMPLLRSQDQADESDKFIVELSTPELIYVNYYQYRNGQSNELIVPTLMFKTSYPKQQPNVYYQTSILVPLEKEIFTELEKNLALRQQNDILLKKEIPTSEEGEAQTENSTLIQ